MYEIKFYEDRHGNKPTVKYIEKLREQSEISKNERIKLKKITEYMRILKKHGITCGEPYVKHIEGNIWELRPLRDRFFFFYWKDNNFVVLHHFVKKTNKTPRREIDQAKRNLDDFVERGGFDE